MELLDRVSSNIPVSKCVGGLCSIQQSDDLDRLWRDLIGG